MLFDLIPLQKHVGAMSFQCRYRRRRHRVGTTGGCPPVLPPGRGPDIPRQQDPGTGVLGAVLPALHIPVAVLPPPLAVLPLGQFFFESSQTMLIPFQACALIYSLHIYAFTDAGGSGSQGQEGAMPSKKRLRKVNVTTSLPIPGSFVSTLNKRNLSVQLRELQGRNPWVLTRKQLHPSPNIPRQS